MRPLAILAEVCGTDDHDRATRLLVVSGRLRGRHSDFHGLAFRPEQSLGCIRPAQTFDAMLLHACGKPFLKFGIIDDERSAGPHGNVFARKNEGDRCSDEKAMHRTHNQII
jgi:hypothetical protein